MKKPNLCAAGRMGWMLGSALVLAAMISPPASAQTPTTLASFDEASGYLPVGTLIADANGNLFGTTSYGGPTGWGTVFEIPKINGVYATTPTVLVSFNGVNAGNPAAGLVADADGNLFGTTTNGAFGTVFEVPKTNGIYASSPTILVSFNRSNGELPLGNLIADADGNLFGTTALGGAYGLGTVFEIPKINGVYATTPTVLVNFNGGQRR